MIIQKKFRASKYHKEERKMKRIFAVMAVLAAVALIGAGVAMAGISNTKHNLSNSASPSGRTYFATSTNEICVFCHTPHNSSGTQPLWNRAVNNTGFTTYGTTMAGTTTGATASSETMLCFSCHDGVSALDVLSNFPGSSTSITMNGANTLNASFAKLDKDLGNDHPVGIVYNAGTASLNTISNTVTGQATVRVLTANTLSGENAVSQVECSSCHDPHLEATSFLRVTNASSALCLACHNK
jgi:predicted CXXCH cytochrome family protein